VSRSGEILLTRSVALLCGVFVSLSLTTVGAAPTVTWCRDNVVTSSGSHNSDAHVTLGDTVNFADYSNSSLSGFAEEFLMPPEGAIGLSSRHAKSLPAVPGTLLMVLVGFACVSLVRDRRVWVAALAGALWAGQAHVKTLPGLAQRIVHTNYKAGQICLKIARHWHLEKFSRLRGDFKSIQYAGLLHHLAGIPAGSTSSQFKHRSRKNPDMSGPSQYALIYLPNCAACPTRALTSEAWQFTRFSPAFMFGNVARGPPEKTPEKVCSIVTITLNT